MECIVHIGTEKTGSTSLQRFLSLNRSSLLENGIAYTKTLGETVNNGICLLSYSTERRDNLTQKINVVSDTDFRQKQQKLKRRFKNEIAKIVRSGAVKKFIISSELIQSRLKTQKDVERLRSLLVDELGFDKITVVVYLRDPALTAQSLFSTAMKVGHSWRKPPPPNDDYFGNICDHESTLKRFGAVFGEDSLVIRLFQRGNLRSDSIITDFFYVLQEPIMPGYILPENSNPSLSSTAVSLLREINAISPKISRSLDESQRSHFISILENNSTSSYKMSQELKTEYDDYFAKSNEWVRKKYFPQREQLFFRDSPNCENPEQLFVSEIANVIVDIMDMNMLSRLEGSLKSFARSLAGKKRSMKL